MILIGVFAVVGWICAITANIAWGLANKRLEKIERILQDMGAMK